MVSVLVSILTLKLDIQGPIFLALGFALIVYFIFLFKNPRLGLIILIIYSFLSGFIGREIVGLPSGTFEALLITTGVTAFFVYNSKDLVLIKNDFTGLIVLWFVISVMEVANPAGASIEGWMGELRTIALYPMLIVLLGFIMIRTNKNLNFVLFLFLILALIACFNGIKQQHLGLSVNEQDYLDKNPTHLIWGKLRVFSFYDAAQFGSSQAQFAIISIVLAFGSFKLWKRIVLFGMTCLFLYGMLISGTRGVIIVIVIGAFTAIVLSKSYRILLIGSVFMLLVLIGLKYTHIGSGNYEIYRLRSALNPEDASLNVRFSSQELFAEYLKTRPFGGGLGVTGYFGHKFNIDNYLSTIEPDSFWVKVWVMYGIVGLVFWFCIYMYILGKGCGIVWKIKNDKLRFKLIALLSGAMGVFFCSYGNEIMNIMPSLLVFFLSLVMVYQGPRLDRELQLEEAGKLN
jgi:O-antigen ligase